MASEMEMEKVVDILREARQKVRQILGAAPHETTRDRATFIMTSLQARNATVTELLEKVRVLEKANTFLSGQVNELLEENSKLSLRRGLSHTEIAVATYDDLCKKYECKGHLGGFVGRVVSERDDLKARSEALQAKIDRAKKELA